MLVFSGIVILLSGCKKLDEKPKGFVAPQNFFKTISQCETVFAGCMGRIWEYWEESGYSYGWRFFIYDDQIDGGDLNIPYNHASGLWKSHYANILNLNTLLRSIKAGSVQGSSQAEIDAVIAEAKFHRAWNYFMLVRMFGDLPLYTDEEDDPAINPKARNKTEEVYGLIEADFQEAANLLPHSWDAEHRGRPTSGAAKGLLAKAYLTMATAPLNKTEYYQKAANMAKAAMTDPGGYELVYDINDVFKLGNKYSKEMMWSFNSNSNYLVSEVQIWAPYLVPNADFSDGWGDISADRRMDTLWPEQPRKEAYLLTSVNGSTYDTWGTGNPTCRKWLMPNIPLSDYENYTNSINLPIIRFADVLLIFAEAENMANGGPTQEACDAINMVVDRANGYTTNAGHPHFTTAMSKQQFDDGVIMERNWELCFEYDRWFDICRKRILDKVSPEYILQNFSNDDYLFPIPEVDLRLNPLLTQNPGYPTPQ